MTARRALVSALHLLVICILFAAGFLCVSLAYLPLWRVQLADIVLFHVDICAQAGYSLLGVALFFLLAFYGLHRGKFVRFLMGRNVIELREKAIWNVIETFFSTHHSQLTLLDLEIVSKSKLHLQVAVHPSEDPEQVHRILEQSEEGLTRLFYDCFGYKRSFVLSVDAKKVGLC